MAFRWWADCGLIFYTFVAVVSIKVWFDSIESVSLGSSLIIFLFYFYVSWSILIEINDGQPIPLMWYLFILLFFRILVLENIAKILTTGPRLRVCLRAWLDGITGY